MWHSIGRVLRAVLGDNMNTTSIRKDKTKLLQTAGIAGGQKRKVLLIS